MATRAGFRVDTDDLASLAAGTEDVAAQVRTAAGRARPIDPAAYGLIGTGFGLGAFVLATTATETISGLASRTDRAADALRATLAAYASVEGAAAALFDGMAQ